MLFGRSSFLSLHLSSLAAHLVLVLGWVKLGSVWQNHYGLNQGSPWEIQRSLKTLRVWKAPGLDSEQSCFSWTDPADGLKGLNLPVAEFVQAFMTSPYLDTWQVLANSLQESNLRLVEPFYFYQVFQHDFASTWLPMNGFCSLEKWGPQGGHGHRLRGADSAVHFLRGAMQAMQGG